jgi:hypothetical protein
MASVDPLETMIKWLAANLSAAGGRVANKHRFTDGWTYGQSAVSVHPDEISTEAYAKVHLARVECRLYGASAVEIGTLYNGIQELCRSSNRNQVVTSLGTALMQFCSLSSGLSVVWDDDLNQDIGIIYLFAMIAQDSVG